MTTKDIAAAFGLDLDEDGELADEEVELDEDGFVAHDPDALQDAHIAATVSARALLSHFCWSSGLGWMAYRAGVWRQTNDAKVSERVRNDLIAQQAREAREGADVKRLAALAALLSANRIRAIVYLARGIIEVDIDKFDQHPDLLNVGNGVVDLATGTIGTHDPTLYLTKKTRVDYVPNATSPDWDSALEALPVETISWFQQRIGQAATGHMTPDDKLVLLQGGGSNGKTTVVGAIGRALGDHAIVVPERLLLANPSDHPTELTTLRGARFALLEETPEARHLNVKRLKDTIGTPVITARQMRKDNITWESTHSLFVTTNFKPKIDETDHGTWRRLALLRFPYTFKLTNASDAVVTGELERLGIDGLRERLRDGRQGQHEAVLAWVVAGARSWYDADRVMSQQPNVVTNDTAAWRAEADLIIGFLNDRLVFDPTRHVASTDLFEDFSTWIVKRGHKAWSDQTFTSRFLEHGHVEAAKVEKRRVSTKDPGLSRPPFQGLPLASRFTAHLGIRFRTAIDDDAEGEADGGEPSTDEDPTLL